MSLNGLVHPDIPKCQSLNWSWVRAQQLAPQGYGPTLSNIPQCNYGEYAPYIFPETIRKLENTTPFRIEGYPNVTQCSRLAPLLYSPKIDKNRERSCQINRWPYGFYCGNSYPYIPVNKKLIYK